MTLRLRLTLLYGACFLAAGAGLLAITYALVSHDTVYQRPEFVRGARISLVGPGGVREVQGNVPPRLLARLRALSIPGGLPPSVITQIKKAGQKQIDEVVARARTALRTQRARSLRALITRSGIALGIMAMLSIALGWLVAGRALRPLRTMNVRARRITADNLHERLGLEGRGDELGELAETFDGVLSRLERAFESQRRFVANASHELRTPITLQRALVEVALADSDASAEELRHTCARVLAAGEQQERVIEALLALARGQAGLTSAQPVELSSIVESVAASRMLEPGVLDVRLELAPAVVVGDGALLERLAANLLDNALAYNVEDGWVSVSTGVEAGTAVLRLVNPGQEVPAGRVPELFEPFRRLDGERLSGGGGGLGLGLSIAAAIVSAHGGTIDASPRRGGGLEVTVRLPARSALAIPSKVPVPAASTT